MYKNKNFFWRFRGNEKKYLLDILKKGEAIGELEKLKIEGKTRFIGCSGDNEVALWAAKCGVFDTIQTSFSITDQ